MNLELVRQVLKEKPKEETVMKVKITDAALKKMQAYAKAIQAVKGEVEVYCYLVCPKDSKNAIATDIYLPFQNVGGAYCRVDANKVIETGNILKKNGFKILGFSHSHSNFHCFHSPTDDENMEIILNEIASSNFMEIPHKTKLIKGDMETEIDGKKLRIKDTKNNVVVELDFNGKFNGKVVDSCINSPIKIGFAYSIVVNAKGDKPYCEIATKEFCPMYFRELDSGSVQAELEIVKGGDAKFDIEKMKKEITEKVTERSWWEYEAAATVQDDNEVVYLTRSELKDMMHQRDVQTGRMYESRIRKLAKTNPMLRVLLKMWDFIAFVPEYSNEIPEPAKEEKKPVKLKEEKDDKTKTVKKS